MESRKGAQGTSMTRQRAWQLRQREKGKCITCGRKQGKRRNGEPSEYCQSHYEKRLESQRKRRAGAA
jgi:hypothetical protein